MAPLAEGNSPTIRSAVLALGMLVAQQVAGKATRDALFLSNFDVTALPLAAGGAAMLSLLGVLAFAKGMALLTPARMVPLALTASSCLLVGEWSLSLTMPRAAALAVYLHMSVFGGTLVSGFWSLVNERLDPHSAKQAVGKIGIGSSLGGLLGGLMAWRVAAVVSLPTMLLAMAALGLLCLLPLARLRPRASSRPQGAPSEATPALSGLRLIRDEPYLRDLALLVGLLALLEALLDYVFNAATFENVARGAALMSFFALYHSSIALLGLAAQATLVRPSLEKVGLAATMALPPGVVAVGSGVVMVIPTLAATTVLRGTQAVLRNSLFRSAYELLYTPLPQDRKRPSKAIVDVGCDRLGTTLGSGLVMLVLLVAPARQVRLPLLALAAAVATAMALLARLFQRRYLVALEDSLRAGVIDLAPGDAVDVDTRMTLASLDRERQLRVQKASEEQPVASAGGLPNMLEAARELGSGDRDRIRRVLSGDQPLDRRLLPFLIPLLGDDLLFRDVLRALRAAASDCVGQLVDVMLDRGQDVVVRRRIPRVLGAVPTQRTADGLLQGLRDDRYDIRLRCTQALVKLKKQSPLLQIASPEVFSAALRELAVEGPSERSLDHVFDILSLALEREPLKIALWALRSDDAGLGGTALEYLENVLPSPVRESLWPRLGKVPPPQGSGRPTEEIRDELLRSTTPTGIRGLALRKGGGAS